MFKELKEKIALSIGTAGVFTMGVGNLQLNELSNDIKKLNDTMIVIVQKQQYSEKTIVEMKQSIDDLKEFRIEVIKSGIIK